MATRPPAGRYALDDALLERRLDPVPGGTNLLVVGEDGSGALAFVSRALARAPTYGEVVILVATDRPTADLVAGYRSRLSDAEDLDHLYVVDASHSGLKRETGPLSPARIEAASSPADVTGIGVGVTNHLRSVRSDRVRLGVCSLSAVVDCLGPERAFAFAHVMTSRVRSADHLGLFVVDPTRHDPEHVRVLQSLVDGTLTFREADDGRRQVRGTGAVDAVGEWTDVRTDG